MNPKDHYSITEKDFENCLKQILMQAEYKTVRT